MGKATVAGILVSVLLLTVCSVPSAAAGGAGKIDSSLRLLKALRGKNVASKRLDARLTRAATADKAVITIKYDHVLSPAEIDGAERTGISFYYIGDAVARTGTIYPIRVPWSLIDEIAERNDVLRLESGWRPCVYPTLDVSGPEIEADAVWTYDDPLGVPLTGRGIKITDFDSGIDVFHPSFFYADGDTLDWIDVNSNGLFTPGTDAVDLDRNGQPGTDEVLRFTDGWIFDPGDAWSFATKANDDGIFQTHWDWLFADQNGNTLRDFGPGSGFTESDPTYGEPLFIVLDDNNNGYLNVGEKLVALGSSKIIATMNTGSVERTRGLDLIDSNYDTSGHGTAVSGILAGGTAGRHIFAGIAPDAEIIMGNVFSDMPLSFLIPWARSKGADVMLYEFGSFIYEFLDGSSLNEQLVTSEHATIPQITPSGNLARGDKHAIATVAGRDSVTLPLRVPYYNGIITSFYSTTLWTPVAHTDLTFRLRCPSGYLITLVDTPLYWGGYDGWYSYDISSRNTHKLDLFMDHGSKVDVMGNWELVVINNSYHDVEIVSNVADDNSSWAGGSEFTGYASNTKNITLPATSDSSIVNGSYSTRGFESYAGVGAGSISAGEISKFSGRGVRSDGQHQLDVCSPGNYDVYTTCSHMNGYGYLVGSYTQFSGTSAAGPHVAAAAALVKQAFPHIESKQVEHLIKSGAVSDAFTGAVYNDTWGYGKLRILGALQIATSVTDIVDGIAPPTVHLGRNYPNPFNPTTWIPFYLPEDGVAHLAVYDVNGARVRTLRNKWYHRGAHSVLWDGRDATGAAVASGIYFCTLRQGNVKQTTKMVLIR